VKLCCVEASITIAWLDYMLIPALLQTGYKDKLWLSDQLRLTFLPCVDAISEQLNMFPICGFAK